MKLYDTYVRFMVWLGAEPPEGYEYLLPQEATTAPLPVDKTPEQTPPPVTVQPEPTSPKPATPPTPSKPQTSASQPSAPNYTGEAARLYKILLLKAMNNHKTVKGLIKYERKLDPWASDEEVIQSAIDRWERDYR